MDNRPSSYWNNNARANARTQQQQKNTIILIQAELNAALQVYLVFFSAQLHYKTENKSDQNCFLKFK